MTFGLSTGCMFVSNMMAWYKRSTGVSCRYILHLLTAKLHRLMTYIKEPLYRRTHFRCGLIQFLIQFRHDRPGRRHIRIGMPRVARSIKNHKSLPVWKYNLSSRFFTTKAACINMFLRRPTFYPWSLRKTSPRDVIT